MTLIPINTTSNLCPFHSLDEKEKNCILAYVMKGFYASGVTKELLAIPFKQAYQVILGKQNRSTLDPMGIDVLDAFNHASQILLEKKNAADRREQNQLKPEELNLLIQAATEELLHKKQVEKQQVEEYKEYLPNITVLNGLLEIGEKTLLVGGVAAMGMGMLYLRSHKLLALASGCSACVLFIFRSTCLELRGSFQNHRTVIEQLNPENLDHFSDKINNIYTEIKKTNMLMSIYLSSHASHEKKMKPEHWGLQLLTEQLTAAKQLKDLKNSLMLKADLTKNSELTPQLSIASFFEKFEAFCKISKWTAIGIGALALAWTYYAYVQRAYLMVAAGVVHLVVQTFIIRELRALQLGSGRIKAAADTKIKDEFQDMAAQSFLFSRMRLQQANVKQIQSAVVITFDAILKLIPAWKTPC